MDDDMARAEKALVERALDAQHATPAIRDRGRTAMCNALTAAFPGTTLAQLAALAPEIAKLAAGGHVVVGIEPPGGKYPSAMLDAAEAYVATLGWHGVVTQLPDGFNWNALLTAVLRAARPSPESPNS